jgi:hypothetical protein
VSGSAAECRVDRRQLEDVSSQRSPVLVLLALLAAMPVAAAESASESSPAGFFVYGPAGAKTTGGAGKPTALVTSTSDSIHTAGSLRYITTNAAGACRVNGGCIVRGDGLSGTITQASVLQLPDEVTLDFSGAAKQGLQIRGRAIHLGNDNIVRYVRHVGSVAADGVDDCFVVGGKHDVVLDHVTAYGCTDELIEFSNATRPTLQYSMLGRPGHPQHSAGMIIKNSSDVALYRNLFLTDTDRNPLIWSDVDANNWLLENVVSDTIYGMRIGAGAGHTLFVSAVRNVFKLGAARPTGFGFNAAHPKLPIEPANNKGKLYVAGSNTLLDGSARTWRSIHGAVAAPTQAYAEYQDGQGGRPDSWPTAPCDPSHAKPACAQRTLTDPIGPRYNPPTGPAAAELVTLLATEVGATRPCRTAIEAAMTNDLMHSTRTGVPFPTHGAIYTDVTQACGTKVVAPFIDAGADRTSAAGSPVSLDSTVTTAVINPTVRWTVKSGGGIGAPCEPVRRRRPERRCSVPASSGRTVSRRCRTPLRTRRISPSRACRPSTTRATRRRRFGHARAPSSIRGRPTRRSTRAPSTALAPSKRRSGMASTMGRIRTRRRSRRHGTEAPRRLSSSRDVRSGAGTRRAERMPARSRSRRSCRAPN